ncbi:hypothetical protein GCM10010495_72660 [Kitasatospora herbaricolor]|uniref:hypothetical protein n=1 Tax=Kitasatospora herbaricolor TaxID=68217 RepID=UPI00174E5F61|nr:hypothetical protein [Kitasatospora herbaricolor]MDQ0306831.1 hypothetical protein [Kitasatospora herbaricolor]GGV44698.1 hypothetical protein GCM10010495_72660 [Kitasatospora herbaricolor]
MTDQPGPAVPSDRALAARIRGGHLRDRSAFPAKQHDERSALAELHRRHHHAVLAYARGYAAGTDAVRDLAAEAFDDTVTAVRAGRGPTGWWRIPLAAAVERTAARWDGGPRRSSLHADVRSRNDLGRPAALPEPKPGTGHRPSAQGFLVLAEESQTVLWLRLVDELPPEEVALVLGVDPEQVAPLTARALELLQAACLRAYCARHSEDDCRHYGRLLVVAVRSPDRTAHGLGQHLDACPSCRSLLGDLRRIDSAPGEVIRAAVMPGAVTGDGPGAGAAAGPVLRDPGTPRVPGAAAVKHRPRWTSWPAAAGCSTAVAAVAAVCGIVLAPAHQAGGAAAEAPWKPAAAPGTTAGRTLVPGVVTPTAPATTARPSAPPGRPSVTPPAAAAPGDPAPPSPAAGRPAVTAPATASTPSPQESTAEPADAGLLNGDVETGVPAPWRAYNSVRADTSTPRTGTFALRLGAHPSGAEQDLPVAPNTTYRLSGWTVVTADGDLATIGVKNYGGPELRDPVGATTYTYRAIEFTTGPAASRATVYCFKVSGTAPAYCDDLAVVRL